MVSCARPRTAFVVVVVVVAARPYHRYLWADNTTVEPLKLSAPAYVSRLFKWIEDQLNDEAIFPTSFDQDFPSNFKARVSRIFRRLFRVYAHIYYAHFEYIVEQQVEVRWPQGTLAC